MVEIFNDVGREMIFVRNSNDNQHTLQFTYAEWDAFVAGVKNDEFNTV